MLYENNFNTSENQLKLTLKSSTSIDSISRRHTISSYYQPEKTFANNVSESGLLKHWETVEKYYVNRLDSLQKEIDMAISHNTKLSLAREELVQEILELHQKSIELNTRNDLLLKSVTENTSYFPQGVTLEDKPYTPPTPPFNPDHHNDTSTCSSPTDISTIKSSTISPVIEQDETEYTSIDTPKEETPINIPTTASTPVINTQKPSGLFRQLSLRLSTRRKRQNDDPVITNESKKNNIQQADVKLVDQVVPTASLSEPLLHPAAVLNSGRKLSSIRRNFKKSVFGNDLIQQAQSEKRKIPSIVLNCVKEIELRGLTTEGIYRKSGVASQLKELQNAYNSKKEPNLSAFLDIHMIASLLKSYLRSLPTPLISNDFILPPTVTDQERLNKMYALLHSLPTETYCTIKQLIQHLRRVHQNQSVNLMSSRNLAVVLGPTLMQFNSVNEESEQAIQTIELMILQSHILFANY